MDKKTIKSFVIVFLVATLVFTGARFGGRSFANANMFHGTTEIDPETGEMIEPVSLLKDMTPIAVDEGSAFYEMFQSQQRVNILCLGVNDGMTDTIMMCSYDMENQKVDIVSIPRDTYYFRGRGFNTFAHHKINAIYSAQGVVKLAEVVSEILYGMPIHYYAVVEYKDVQEVMKVIGGVKMNVPFHMKYDDTTKGYELHVDIPAGEQTIDASNVMEFLRFRKTNPWYERKGYHSYQGGDIERQELQQEFVKKVIKELSRAKKPIICIGGGEQLGKILISDIDKKIKTVMK